MKPSRYRRIAALAAFAAASVLAGSRPALACADGCTGECASMSAEWSIKSEKERPGYDPRAVEDAGLYIGMKTRDQLRALGFRKALFEFFPGAGTAEAGLVDTFLAAFREHANYLPDDTVEIDCRLDPPDPFHLMTPREVREATGADILVTCKFAGVSMRDREYRPDSAEIRLRRLQVAGLARFRVMITDLTGRGTDTGPLFIDEIPGGFLSDTLYQTTAGVEVVQSVITLYDHFPGLEPDRRRQ